MVMSYVEPGFAGTERGTSRSVQKSGLVYLRDRRTTKKEEILRLKQQYMSWHARRIAEHKKDQTYFDLEYPVPTPTGIDPLIVPTARTMVEELINHLIAEIPILNVFPRNADERAISQAGKLTVWLNGFWHAIDLRAFLRKLIWYDLVRGCHVVRLQYDPTLWPLEPEPPVAPADPEGDFIPGGAIEQQWIEELLDYKRLKDRYEDKMQDWKDYTEENIPIQVDVLAPENCFWEPTEKPRKIVLAWERTIADILSEFPTTGEYFSGMDPTRKVQFCEWCDEEVRGVWVESFRGKAMAAPYWIMEPEEHDYGFFPYYIDGPWKTPADTSDKMYPSTYKSSRSMLQYESTLATQRAHLIRATGYAPLIIKTPTAMSDAQKPIIDMSPAKANYLMPEEDAKYLEPSGSTATLLGTLMADAQSYVEQAAGITDILRGQPKGKSGYQQAQAAAMARVALTPEEHSVIRVVEQTSRGVFKLIRVIDSPVTIVGPQSDEEAEATIRPKDVLSHGRIEVVLRTVLPMDESAKLANAERMQKNKWIPPWEAARMAGVRNPQESHAQAQAADVADEPEIKRAQALRFLQEHDPELFALVQQADQQKQQAAQQQQQQGGQTPGQPKPPAAPGSAQEQKLVQRQARQGGAAPKKLPGGGGDESSSGAGE